MLQSSINSGCSTSFTHGHPCPLCEMALGRRGTFIPKEGVSFREWALTRSAYQMFCWGQNPTPLAFVTGEDFQNAKSYLDLRLISKVKVFVNNFANIIHLLSRTFSTSSMTGSTTDFCLTRETSVVFFSNSLTIPAFLRLHILWLGVATLLIEFSYVVRNLLPFLRAH